MTGTETQPKGLPPYRPGPMQRVRSAGGDPPPQPGAAAGRERMVTSQTLKDQSLC